MTAPQLLEHCNRIKSPPPHSRMWAFLNWSGAYFTTPAARAMASSLVRRAGCMRHIGKR